MKKLTQKQLETIDSKWIKLDTIYIPAELKEDYTDIRVFNHPQLKGQLKDMKNLRKNIKKLYKELKKAIAVHRKLEREIEKLDDGT